MYSFLLPNIVIPILTYKLELYDNNDENYIIHCINILIKLRVK